jgi:hypothetical protein
MIARIVGGGTVMALVLSLPLRGEEVVPGYTFESLCHMSWHELEQIYHEADIGTRPEGFTRGRAIYHGFLAKPRGCVTNFLWKGKHFCEASESLINQFCGVRMIRAHVAPGPSWLDGRPALILDYRETSRVWHDARDETREVAPGLYVGAMLLQRCPEPRVKVWFVLEAAPCCAKH